MSDFEERNSMLMKDWDSASAGIEYSGIEAVAFLFFLWFFLTFSRFVKFDFFVIFWV